MRPGLPYGIGHGKEHHLLLKLLSVLAFVGVVAAAIALRRQDSC